MDTHALVNLTGGLGSGKSRLARRLPAEATVGLAADGDLGGCEGSPRSRAVS
ncbi:hypothetical protein [Streptomyces sp. NBC_01233]|uniref:hypothetical protein n=1 Tax=Streptomyces sp. NBC_01233 TaxID=2903787 RepID=UPI002E0D7B3F|nr:hypothetical protein OG332_44300 [Streptomyces sp. NBC_01233]